MTTESERNSILRQQVAELTASNERLRNTLIPFTHQFDDLSSISGHNSIVDVLNETPSQSLAHIQADAIDKMLDEIEQKIVDEGWLLVEAYDADHLREYSAKLREGKE